MNEQLKIIISAETSKVKKGVEEVKKALDGIKTKSADVEKKLSDLSGSFDKIAEPAKNAMKAVGVAVAGVATALVGTVAATEEYRQNQAQLNAAFEQAGLSAESAAGSYKTLYKVIGDDDQAVESAANIAMLANSEKEAAQWAELASGVLGTFHDTLQPEAFYEAANETLKLGEATGAFAQMLEQTGVMSVEEFNRQLAACTTEQEKQALMLRVSEEAMGAAGDAYDKATANIQAQRDAQARLKEVMAQVGNAVSPVLTAFTNFGAALAEKVAPKLQELSDEYGPKIKDFLDSLAEKLDDVGTWISDNWETIKTVGTVLLAIGAAILTVSTALNVATTATTLFNAVLNMNPIVLIITAIIAAIILVIVYWDDLKAVVIKVWDKIKEVIGGVVDAVVGFFTNLKDKATEIWNNIKTAISEKVNALKTAVTEKFQAIKDGIADKIEAAKTAVTNKFDQIKTNIGNKIDAAKTAVSTKFDAIKTTISTKVENAKSAVTTKFETMKSNIKNKIDGIKSQVTSVFNSLKDKITSPVESAKNKVKNLVDKIKGLFKFKWSLPALKKPYFTISPAGWKVGDLLKGTIPKLSVGWHAQGGVFDSPTLFNYKGGLHGLGENGAEAIVPLEKNTEWLTRIADMLNERMGGGTPIILQVDGKTFAQTCVNSMNDLTRQTGSLQLKLV